MPVVHEREEHSVPSAVYFDTNSLRQAGRRFDADWYRKLQSISADISIPLYAIQIVLDEWSAELISSYEEGVRKCRAAFSEIDFLLDAPSTTMPKVDSANAATRIATIHNARVAGAGITIVPTHYPEIQRLVPEAIAKKAPFDSADRGFRDTIIVESILEHIRSSLRPQSFIVVVTSDDRFRVGCDRITAAGFRVKCAKPLEATEVLSESLDVAWKQHVKEEAAAAVEFLKSQKRVIFDRLNKARVSTEFLRGYGTPFEERLFRIDRIVSAKPTEINWARVGHTPVDATEKDPRYPIMFGVEVRFEIEGSDTALRSLFLHHDPQYLIGDPTDAVLRQTAAEHVQPELERRTITKNVSLSGSVRRVAGSHEPQFRDLNIDEVTTY